jgi:uncharacterized SAM-binding protein YcdF (DUF218 family)
MFILAKIVGFFVTPSNLLTIIGLIGLALLVARRRGPGQFLMIGSLLALAVAGWSPLGNILMSPLENRFPSWDAGRGAPDGIIVLGGAVSPDVAAARGEVALNEAAERMTAIAALGRSYPAARIVFTGGIGRLFGGTSEADVVLPLFESFGIARERVALESVSRNTFENAHLTKSLVQPKPGERWLLVTSAYHMPRSVGVFRRIGFPVEAYPVDWRTRRAGDVAPFTALSAGLARTDTASHEWVGVLAYWLAGRTSELFPAP